MLQGGGNDLSHFYIALLPYVFGTLKYLGGPTSETPLSIIFSSKNFCSTDADIPTN